MNGDHPHSWRFEIAIGLAFGAAAWVWQALQGEYALGLTLFAMTAVGLALVLRFHSWLRRDPDKWARRGKAWAEQNPAASRRLRWVAFPVIGLLWAFIIWALVA